MQQRCFCWQFFRSKTTTKGHKTSSSVVACGFASCFSRSSFLDISTSSSLVKQSSSTYHTMTYKGPELELKCVNTIRAVSADQPEAANSGHPGAPMGCAPMAYLLWAELMKYSGEDPKWLGRDRFVLSNGHACALQYTMLHLTKYGLTKEDLGQFRQLGGPTPGHPECFLTSGVEVCTGPLGMGISNAVGLAMAETHLDATCKF